jgi:hypothetical protein
MAPRLQKEADDAGGGHMPAAQAYYAAALRGALLSA